MRATEKKRWFKQMAIGVIVLLSILVFAACGIAIWDNDQSGDNTHIGCCNDVEQGGSAVETAAFATQNWNPAVLTYNFSLTNNSQALNSIPAGARFRIELWGASGGTTGTPRRGGRSVGEFQNMTNAPMNLLVQVAGQGAASSASNGGGGGASVVWANTVSTANVLVVGGGAGGGNNGGIGGGGNANGANGGGSGVGIGGNNNGTGGQGGRCCCGSWGNFAAGNNTSRGGNQGQGGFSAGAYNASTRATTGCHQGGGGGGVGAGGGSGRGGCCGGQGTGNPGSGVNGGGSTSAGGGGASWNGARGSGGASAGLGGGQGVAPTTGANGGGGGYGGGGGGERITAGGGGGFAGGGGSGNSAGGGGGSGFVRTSHIAGVINFVGGAGGTSGATDSPGGHNGHVRITLLVVPPDQVTFPATRVLTRGVVASGTGAGQMPAFTVSGSGHTQSIPNLNVTTNPANSETIAAGGLSFVGLNPTPGAGGHSGVAFGAVAPTTATMAESNCAVRQGFIYFTSAAGNVVHMQVTHVNRHMVDQHFWVRVHHTTINIYRWVRFTITTTLGDWRPTGNWQNTGTGFDLEDGNLDARRVGTANVTGAPPSLDTNFDTLRWNPTSTMNPTMWMRHAILPGTSREIHANWFKELVSGNGMNGQPMDTRGSANVNLGDRVAFVGAGMFVGGHGNVGGEPEVTMARTNNLSANSTTGPNPRNLFTTHNASITISAGAGEYSARFYVLRVMLELVEHRTTGAMQSTTWATSTLRMQEVDIVFFVAPPPSQSSVPTFTRVRGETITLERGGNAEPGFRSIPILNVTSQATELTFVGLGTNQGIFNSRVATAGNVATTHLSWSFNASAQTIVITVQQWCNNRTFSLQVANAMGQTIWVDFRVTTPAGEWTPQGDFTSATAAAMTGTNRLGIAHTTVMPFIHGNNLIPDGGNWDFNNNGTGIPTLWKTRALETNSVTYIDATEFFTANTGSRDRVVFDMVHGVSINDNQGGRVSVALAGAAVGGHAPQIRLNIQSGTFDSIFFVINAYVALREIHNANAHHMFQGNIRVNIIFTIVQPVTQTSVPHFGGTTQLLRGASLTINRTYHSGNNRGIGDLNVIARSNRQSVAEIEFSNAANAISGTLSNEGVFLNAGMTQPASAHLSWTLTAGTLHISGFYTILTNQSFFVGVRTDRGLVIPVEFRVTTQRDIWEPTGNAWNTAGTAVRYNPGNAEGSYKVGMSNTQTVPPGTDAAFNGAGNNPLGGWRFNPHHATPALTMWVERVIHPTLTAAAYFTFTPASFFQQSAGNNDFDVLTFGRSFTFWQNNQGGRITGIGTNPGAPLASVDNIGFTALTIRIAPGAPASFDDLFFTMRVRVQEQERAAVSAGRVFSYVYAYVVFRLRAEPPGQTAIPSFTLARGAAIAAPFAVVGNTIPALNVDDSDNPLSTQLRFENFAAGSTGNANYANRTGIFLDANTSRPARDHLFWTITATQIVVSEVRAWSPGLSFWIEISNDVGIYTWIRFVVTTTVENYVRTGGWEQTAGGVVAHEPSRQTRVGMPTTSIGPGARSTGENGMSWNFSHAITGTNHPVMWVMRSIDPGSSFDVRATDFFTLSSNDAARDALVFTEDRWLVNNQGGRISLTADSPGGQLGAFASTVTINIGSDAITGFTPQFYFLRLVLQWRENSAANNGHLFTHFGSGGNQVVYVVFTITQPPRQLDAEVPVFEVYRGAEVGTSGVVVRGSNPPLHLSVSRTSDDKGFTLLNVSDFHNNAQSSQYIEFVGMGDNTGIFLTRGTAQPATDFLSWTGNATGFRITDILAVANRAFYIRVRNDRNREGWISFRLTTVSRGWENAGGAEAWTETQAWHNAAEGFRVGRAVTPVEANPDAVPFTSWYFNRRNPMALTMWVEQPILPGESFEFRATDFFTAVDPLDSVVFTAFSGDGGINFNFPENQPGISLTSHMAPAPMQMHAERLQINVALGNYPSQFFYFAAHVELRERSVVNNRILHRGPIPIFVVFRIDNVRSRLSNMIHANLNVGAARTIPLSDFAVDPNGDRMNIVDVVVPQREWLPVDRFGRAVPIPTSANPLFGENQGIHAMGAGRQNQLTRYAPNHNLDVNNGVATHHPFNDGADDRLNYRLGAGTIGHAQGTLPTGFSPNLVTRLPDDLAPSLADTNNPLSNSAFARVAIVHGGQSLTITGLRPSRWQYHPDRAIPPPLMPQGFVSGAVGHFYILVRIQDDGAVSDLGIWLPIAISINPRAIGERDARPANLTMEAGSEDIGTRTDVSLWQGGGVQYFSPFGAGTSVANAVSLLSSAGTFGGGGMAALGPVSPIAQSPDHHWSAVTGSSNNNATRALEEGIFIDWRYMHTTRDNLRAEGGVDVNGQIGSQERFLDGEGFSYLTHTTNFHTYFEVALVPLYLPRAAIARFSPQELDFAVAQRGLLRTQVGGVNSPNLTLGDVNSELTGSEADIEIVSFYGLRITALRSTLGLNLEFGIPMQSVREGLRMYQPAFGTMPAAVSLRTTARLLVGIVNSGPSWISYEAFDGAAAGSTGHHYGQSAFFNDTINSPIFENDYNNPIYEQVGPDLIKIGYQQILVGYNRTPTGVFNLHIPRDAVYSFSVYDFVHDADIAVDFDRSLYNPRGAENAARQGAMASEISRTRPVMQAGAPGFGSAASLLTVMNDRLRFETPELETVQINYANVTRVVPLSGRYAQMTMQQGAFGWSGIHAQFTISAIYRSPHVPTVFVLEAVDSRGESIEITINVFVINSAPEIQDRACYFTHPSQSFDFSVSDSTRGDMATSPDRTTNTNVYPDVNYGEAVGGAFRSVLYTTREYLAHELARDIDDVAGTGLSFVGMPQVVTFDRPVASRSDLHAAFNSTAMISLGDSVMRAEFTQGTSNRAGHTVLSLTAISSTEGFPHGVWVAFRVSDGHIIGGMLMIIRVRVFNSRVRFNEEAFTLRDTGANTVQLPHGRYLAIAQDDTTEPFYFTSSQGMIGTVPGINMGNSVLLGTSPDGLQHIIPVAGTVAYRGQLPTVPTHFFGQNNLSQFNAWGSLQTGIGGNSALGTDFFRVFVPDNHTVLSHGWNNGQIAPGAFELVWFERQGSGQYNPVTVGTGRQNLHWALRMTLPPAHFADSALRISFAIADSDQEVHGGRAGGFATHGRSNHNDTQHNEVRHFTLHVVQSARTLLNNFTDLTYNGAHTLNHTLRGRRHTGGSTVEPNAEYHISGAPFNTISFDGITVPGAGVDGSAPSSIYVPYAYFASAWLSAPQGGNASPSAIGLATTYTSLRTTASGIDAAAARASLSLRSGDRVWTGGTFTQNPYITVEFLGQDTNTARFLNSSSPYYMGNRLIRYLVGPGTASGITSGYNGTPVITNMTNAAAHRDVTSGLRITKNDIRGDNLVLSVSVMAWGSAGGLFNAASEPIVIDVPLRVENDPIEVQSLGGQVVDGGVTTTVPGGFIQNGMPVLDVLTDMNIGARTVGLVNTNEPDSFQALSRRDFNFGFNGETVNRGNQLGPAATRNSHRERAMFLARSVNFDFNASNAGFDDFETRNSTQGQTSVREGFFGGQTAMDNAIADPGSFNANRVNPNAGFERFFRITNLMQTNNITTGSDSDSFAIIPIRRTQLNTDLYSQDTSVTAPSPESFGLRQCTRAGSLTQGSWYFPLHLLVYDEFAQSGWYNASMHAVLIRVFIFNAAPQANSGFLTVNPQGDLIGAVPYRTIRVMSNTSRTFSLREMLFEGDARVGGMHFMTRQEIMTMIIDPLERMTTDYVYLHRGSVLSGAENGIAFSLDDTDNTRSLTISAGQRLPTMDLADRAGALEFVFADAMGGGFGPWTGSALDRERRATISFEIRFNNSPPTLTPEIIMGEQLITLRTGDWFRLAVGCRNAFTNNGARQVGTINNLQPGFDGTTGWWQQASDQNRNFSQAAADFVSGSGHLGDFIVASHERPWGIRFGTAVITRPGSDEALSAGASELTPFTNHNMLYSSFTQGASSPLSLEFRAVGVVDRLNIAIPVYDEQNARTMLRLQIRIESTPPALINSHPDWSALGLSRDAQSGRFDVRMYVGDEISFELLHFVYDADRGDNERLFLRNFGVANFMIDNQPRSGDGIIAIDYGAFGPSGRQAFTISAHNFHGIGLNDEQSFSTVVFDVQDPQGPLWQRVELRVTTMRSPLNFRSDAVRETTVTVRSAQEQADAEPDDINVVIPLVGHPASSDRNTTVIVDNDFGALNTRYDIRVYSLINVSEVGGVHGAAINPLSTDFIQNRDNHLVASFRHNIIGSGHLFDRVVRFDPALHPTVNIALGVLEFWRFVDLNSFTISPSGCSLLLRPLTRTPSNPQGVLGALPLLIVVTRCNARTDDEHANSRDFRLNLRIQNSRPAAVGNTANNGWTPNAEFNHLDGNFLSFHGRGAVGGVGGSENSRTFTVFEQGNIGAAGDSDFVLFRDRDLDDTIPHVDVRWIATHQINADTGAIVSSPQINPMGAVSYQRITVSGNPLLRFTINHRVNFAGTVQNAHLPTKVVYEVAVRDVMGNHPTDLREGAAEWATTLIYVVIWPSTPQFTTDYADNLPSNMSIWYNDNVIPSMHELSIAVSPDAPASLDIASVLSHTDLIPNRIGVSDRIVFERVVFPENPNPIFSFDSISGRPGIQNAMYMGLNGSTEREGALFSAHTAAAAGNGVPNTTIVFNALTRYRGTTVTAYLHIRSEITGLRTAAPLRIILTTANDAPTLRTDINPVHEASVGADGVATIHIFAQGGERNVSPVDVNILDFFTDTNPYDTNHWQGGGDTFLRIANPSVGLDARNPHAVVSLFNLQTVRIQPSAGVYGQFQFHLLVADGPGPILSRFFPIPAPYEGGSVTGYPFSIDNFRQNSAQIAASRAHNQSITTDDKFIVVRFVVYVTRSPYDVHINNVLSIPQFSTHRITPSRLLDQFVADTTWQRDRTDAEKAAAVEVPHSEGFYIHGLDLVDRTSTNVTIFRNGVEVPNSELPVFLDPEDEITRWSIRANSWRYGDSDESIAANTTYLIAHIGVHGSPDAPAIRHFTVRSIRNRPPELRTTFVGYYEFIGGGQTQFRRHVSSIVEDPENDVLTLVSVHSRSSVIVAASRDGNYLVLDFRGRGSSDITVRISDAVGIHEFTFTARNDDLPNPNVFVRIWADVQMRPVMYGIILAIIILLIIILLIVIAVIKRRQRTKAELEALLIAELEMEEQMLKISQSLAAEPPFGYLGGPGYGAAPPPMMLGSGGAQQYPAANPMMLNAGQPMPQSSFQESNFNNQNPYNLTDDEL